MHTSYPPRPVPRERYLRVRLADDEFAHLADRAAAEGRRSVSELARMRLLTDFPQGNPLTGVEPLQVIHTRN